MDHLGGHYGGTCMTIPTFDYIRNKFNIKSVIDIGCGPAGMTEYINYSGVYCIGVDGDTTLEPKDYVLIQDYTLGKLQLDETFDLAYSTEFLEHVYDTYIPNFIDTYQKANYVFCSAAPPGQGGHHHVNEQPISYWIEKFKEYGFTYDEITTEELKKTCNDKVVTSNGMFFVRDVQLEVDNSNRVPFTVDYEKLKAVVNRHATLGEYIVGYKPWE
jgi:SAM-dependent methyltransferase